MSVHELGFEMTDFGELTLRRRNEPRLNGQEVFEVKLGDEYLMSSLFTESERQLAKLGLAPLQGELDVVVGGLGLGYTVVEVLRNSAVSRLLVIDLFQAVIDWHKKGIVPNGDEVVSDKRCELRQGDFFELALTGFDAFDRERMFDAVLMDIDHSPHHFLNAANERLYSVAGLNGLRSQIKQGGIFALWSNDPADDAFTERLNTVFGSAEAYNVVFRNPYTEADSVNSVYVARHFL
jgi:spermidine synthase